jgi:tRNA G18 (ribose-2'-O)-methylase SpoU
VIDRAAADDPALEPYRHVGDPAWLRGQELFVAEGRLVVERMLASREYDVHSILVTPAARDALTAILDAAGCDVYVREREALSALTGFNFHRGCLALVRRPPARPLSSLARMRRVVGLEGVGNPDNVGGIFRTAAALGADGVALDAASGDPLYRKAIRTSMAATLRMPWARARADEWHAWLDGSRRAGFTLVSLTPHPDAAALDDVVASVGRLERLLILLGGEGTGLSAATLQESDVRVRIPIHGGFDSLNVVVAAGIALERLR